MKTVEEQMAALHMLGGGRLARWLAPGLAAAAVIGVAIGATMGWVPAIMIAAFAGFVAFAAAQSLRHLRDAARALAVGRRAPVRVVIEVDDRGDSPAYHAVVAAGPCQTWRLEFLPMGWKPVAGTVDAEARFLSGIAWPVLLVGAEGLIYPRYAPKRLPSTRPAPR